MYTKLDGPELASPVGCRLATVVDIISTLKSTGLGDTHVLDDMAMIRYEEESACKNELKISYLNTLMLLTAVRHVDLQSDEAVCVSRQMM